MLNSPPLNITTTTPSNDENNNNDNNNNKNILPTINTSKKPFSFLSFHPTSCLIIFILSLQLFLLSLSHYIPFYPNHLRLDLPPISPPLPSIPDPNHHRLDLLPVSPPLPSIPDPNHRRVDVPLVSPPIPSIPGPNPTPNQCRSGKFYIYDLPKQFNSEILAQCKTLSPWGSRCEALSNNGLGREAKGIERVIPIKLAHTWYWTDQFANEIIFHNRLLNHDCRTMDTQSATAFYIPFYAGLAAEKYLWSNSTTAERDSDCERMLHWLKHESPFFNRSNGWDHFTVMGRITWDFRRSKDKDWGSQCIYLESMRNITRLLIERNPWDYFDIGVPYPSGFHPMKDDEVLQWQEFVRSRERHALFCFAGATRGFIKDDFRAALLNQCRDSGELCRLVDCAGTRCSNGTSEILETFLDSEFCLQPRGDSFTRRSIFDCMVAGSIPVFFWRRTAYFQYEWFLPGEPESYSVFIHRSQVKNGTLVRKVLEKYSKDEVKKMRDKVVEFIPNIIYANPVHGLKSIKDAVDIAVDGVLNRIKEQKENGYNW